MKAELGIKPAELKKLGVGGIELHCLYALAQLREAWSLGGVENGFLSDKFVVMAIKDLLAMSKMQRIRPEALRVLKHGLADGGARLLDGVYPTRWRR